MEKPLQIVWKGRRNINEILMEVNTEPYELPESLIEARDRIWNFLDYFDPDQYNGSLFLVNLHLCSPTKFPTINIQPITYRNFKTLQYAHRGFPPVNTDYEKEIEDPSFFTRSGPVEENYRHDVFQDYSLLCCVYLIFNSNRSHVLVGKRTEVGGWGDGYFASPGGIIEWSRLKNITKALYKASVKKKDLFQANQVKTLLLSELDEEIHTELQTESTNIVGIINSRNRMFTNFVIEVIVEDCKLNERINTNHEFVNKQMSWQPINQVKQISDNQLFGGLRFMKYSSLY